MIYDLDPEIIKLIATMFPDDLTTEVQSLLGNTQLWAESSGPPPRIHCAFLLMSSGKIDSLKNILKYHSGDWRDALINTGLANENWRDILLKKGIDCRQWK
jgi:hypothetical protein